MNTLNETQQDIVDEFSVFEDWLDRYNYLIELGNDLPAIDPHYRTNEYLINGCQSRVWLKPEYRDGKITFSADSDAIIILDVFSKKAQTTPHAVIERCKRRLREYDRG